jgi:phage replication-related protein YjqB (UPF0714/DUF867 family)
MLDELLAYDGVSEQVELGSPFGFMALHGGIEAGTADLARRSAAATGASLYVVQVPFDLWWHVPSTAFDPAHSAGLSSFLDHAEHVVSLHGFGRPDVERTMLVGGANRAFASGLAHQVRLHTSVEVIDRIDDIPAGLRGLHPKNPVNMTSLGGAQLEMTADIRLGGDADDILAALVAAATTPQTVADTEEA